MIDYIQFLGSNGAVISLNDDTFPMTTYDSQVETTTQENQRPNQHGLFPTYTFMGKRTFHMEGDIFAASSEDFLLKRQQLLAAFIPTPEYGSKQVGQLVVKYTGMSEAVVSDCYLDGLPLVPLEALSPSRGTYAVALQAFDPIMYGQTAIVAKSGLPGGNGGFIFPFTFYLRFTLGTGGGGDVNVVNGGNASVHPVVTIYGPCTSPSIILRAFGQEFVFALTGLQLNSGEYAVIDFKARTVTTSTFGSAYSFIQPGSVWWTIPPGVSTISFIAFTASSPAHAEISYSNGYMI